MAWVKGQSGNPGGRKAHKDALTGIFWKDLLDAWKDGGKDALVAMRKSHPNQFIDVVARVLPKEEQAREIKHSLEVTLRQPDWLKLEHDAQSTIDILPDKSKT